MAGLAWLYASHYPEPINIIIAIATTLSFACGFVMIALEQRFPKESVPVPQRWADTTRAFATLLGCIVGLIVGLQQATVGRDEAAVAGAPESGGHGFMAIQYAVAGLVWGGAAFASLGWVVGFIVAKIRVPSSPEA